jgi:hypothetical protein
MDWRFAALLALVCAFGGCVPQSSGEASAGFLSPSVASAYLPLDGKADLVLEASAAAVIVAPGIAATNAHNANLVATASVIGVSTDYDLLFFRTSGGGVPPIGRPTLGETVMAYGLGVNRDLRQARGIVRSLAAPVEARCAQCPVQTAFTFEAGAGEGFSGGPVADCHRGRARKRSYLDYAMSVIVSRALPDARDGLKPVHRRILYSMHENGNDWNKPYRKSARVVGDTMGKYHPHGDQAIYDALVRMAQDFSMRVPLIDGQGNFGSVDGDPPAAMRYTEVRRAKIAHALTEDLDKDTVEFQDNYDASEREPVVLPARFPNLLVNGASGIAVGMATNVPPHNLGEVIDACLAYIDDPSISLGRADRDRAGARFSDRRFDHRQAGGARARWPADAARS